MADEEPVTDADEKWNANLLFVNEVSKLTTLTEAEAAQQNEQISDLIKRASRQSKAFLKGIPPDAEVLEANKEMVTSIDTLKITKSTTTVGDNVPQISGLTYKQPPSDASIMYVKTKETKPKVIVTFDKTEIRKKYDKISFNEARRLLDCIYDTIVQELYEEGAPCWARHFEEIFHKEQQLFEEKAVRNTLNKERPFLYEIIDRIKKSNKALLEEHGTKTSYKYLYELMLYVEPYRNMFDWFITDLYEIIARLCKTAENLDTGANEVIARIYFKYSVYRDITLKDTTGGITWIDKALKLAQGELWSAEIGKYEMTLHELIAPTYADMLIKKAKQIMYEDFDLALRISRRAILIVCEVDKNKFQTHFCRAQLFTAELLIENGQFQNATDLLLVIQDDILNANSLDLKRMATEFYYRLGSCIMNSPVHFQEREYKAVQIFENGLNMSRMYDQKHFEALILLNLGKLYSMTHNKTTGSPVVYRKALQIFIELGDVENIRRTKYLLAELNSTMIFPHLMDLLKSSGTKYCNYYKLRMWKNQCKPFWAMEKEDLMDKVDPIYCLLKENA